MKITLYLMCLIYPLFLCADNGKPGYKFQGTHYIAEYFDCDSASITDTDTLICVMNEAVKESGATVLNTRSHVFPETSGLTMLTMLSESHASIHTYPLEEEGRACFVDLFTCGDKCDYEKFEEKLVEYLKPRRLERIVLVRPTPLE